jgi:aminoglycoside 6'-N-acetyltransferase I
MELIIEAQDKHLDEIVKMGLDLWPEQNFEGLKEDFDDILHSEKYQVLLYSSYDELVGFIYLSIRSDYVEGSDSSPTGFVEGIYVKPDYRRRGISRKLLAEGEQWIREQGCTQIGSDILIDNQVSYDFHTSIGFKEAGRLIAFIKNLD